MSQTSRKYTITPQTDGHDDTMPAAPNTGEEQRHKIVLLFLATHYIYNGFKQQRATEPTHG